MTTVINDALEHGHEFSFVQILRLVRGHLEAGGKEGVPPLPWQDRVRIRPELSLAFPAADVAGFERDGDDFLITATFLGLYGASSPLPNFYTEELLEEAANDESSLRDFLDIINRRLYHLYFQCWSKYRLFIRIVEENNPVDWERLFCLIGLGEKELASSIPDAPALLRYTGILTQYPRSAAGLKTILRDALGLIHIRIIQNVKRMVKIPQDQRMAMGINACVLGVDTVLGCEIADRMGKIIIEISSLTWEELNAFLPGTDRHEKISRYTRFYLVDPLEVELKLVLAAGEARPIQIGDPQAGLGLNMWCFSGDGIGEVSAVYQPAPRPFKSSPPEPGTGKPAEERGFIDCYRQELASLRKLTADYAKEHPALAPRVCGQAADPGVERLLEGTAFYNALLQKKLDDDFPEVIHEVTRALHPWLLRPIPAATIISFTPKATLNQPVVISSGAEVQSIPVEGTRCIFRTCFDVTVHPFTLLDATYSRSSGQLPRITLRFQVNGTGMFTCKAKTIRLFLADDYPEACDLRLLLTRYLERITIASDKGVSIDISTDCLKPVGFEDDETILTEEKSLIPGHLMIQEFFLFRDKFLFLDLTGLERCAALGDTTRFAVNFELKTSLPIVPKITGKSFVLYAAPAVNLFKHAARPISFVSGIIRHPVQPLGKPSSHFRIYSVDRITGLDKGDSSKIVYDIHNHSPRNSASGRLCHITQCPSPVEDSTDTFLSISCHEFENRTARIKLDIDLTCTNGYLPEKLAQGDIRERTSTIPESVETSNIKSVTAAMEPDSQHNRQWRLFSGFSLNSVSLCSPDNFRAILRLFIPSKNRNQVAVKELSRKIDSVLNIEAVPTDRLISRAIYRGYDVRMRLDCAGFSGLGDMYLFSEVLERFLAGYVSNTCFVRLVVETTGKGYRFEWPARMGDRWVL